MSMDGYYRSLWSRGGGRKRPTSHRKHTYTNKIATYGNEGAKYLENLPLANTGRSQLKNHELLQENKMLERHENNPAGDITKVSMTGRGIWRPDAPVFVPLSEREA